MVPSGGWLECPIPNTVEDDHLFLLSSELQHLNIGIAALSEVWRPDSSEIMMGGYTDDLSGHDDGYHTQ